MATLFIFHVNDLRQGRDNCQEILLLPLTPKLHYVRLSVCLYEKALHITLPGETRLSVQEGFTLQTVTQVKVTKLSKPETRQTRQELRRSELWHRTVWRVGTNIIVKPDDSNLPCKRQRMPNHHTTRRHIQKYRDLKLKHKNLFWIVKVKKSI
jgi:hypothetical protein